jgi:hypothetical protein
MAKRGRTTGRSMGVVLGDSRVRADLDRLILEQLWKGGAWMLQCGRGVIAGFEISKAILGVIPG